MRLNDHIDTPNSLKKPQYLRHDRRPGIVHLGIGAFHRAHQAWYTEQVLNRCGGHWRIIGVSLRSPAVRDQLAAQDWLYTLEVRDGEQRQQQLIGALAQVIVAPENPAAVIAALASPDIHVVSLTITEKGYYLSADTSGPGAQLNLSHADIQHDLGHPEQPRTALGFLCEAMAVRRAAMRPGLTLISCDNIANNGGTLRGALLHFSQQLDPTLANWIDRHCRFPATMVDRIVPATTATDLDQLAASLGYEDQAAVFCEDFCQWIIEENFAGPVPPWHQVGAEFVADVAPFEAMKLRLLNASHSAIAYFGCLTGRDCVAQVVTQPTLRRAVAALMAEGAATLELPADYDLQAYQQRLLQRFGNTALAHRCQQIAMDGSQKLPNRIMPILGWQRQRDAPLTMTTAVLAAWLYYLGGKDEQGRRYPINDPMADHLSDLVAAHTSADTAALLRALADRQIVFCQAVAADERVIAAISHWLEHFKTRGVLAALQAVLQA